MSISSLSTQDPKAQARKPADPAAAKKVDVKADPKKSPKIKANKK
jgi:hypothetical protein